MNKVYLGIPYTWNPERSFQIANVVAAEFMQQGNIVFSPISHSHPVSRHIKELQLDRDFWMKQDLPMLASCNRMVIIVPSDEDGGYQLVLNSKGLQREIKVAEGLFIEIEYYEL